MSQYVQTALYFKDDCLFDVRIYSEFDSALDDAKECIDEKNQTLTLTNSHDDTKEYQSGDGRWRIEIRECLVE